MVEVISQRIYLREVNNTCLCKHLGRATEREVYRASEFLFDVVVRVLTKSLQRVHTEQ